MNTRETSVIVQRIEDRINLNTWIYSVALLIVGALLIMMIFVLIWLSQVSVTSESNKVLALEANRIANDASVKAAANAAKYDALFSQYSDYIAQSVSAWNKLQKDNYSPDQIKKRGVQVPVAPILRPTGLPAQTDGEIERITRPAVQPTPIKQKIYVPVKKKMKATPTPRPWYKLFDQTR